MLVKVPMIRYVVYIDFYFMVHSSMDIHSINDLLSHYTIGWRQRSLGINGRWNHGNHEVELQFFRSFDQLDMTTNRLIQIANNALE
jgi:hypothetical protein